MAIRPYTEDGKKFYEVYVNGFNSRGVRIQRKRCGIETLRKAETLEFELEREVAKLREEAIPYRWHEWFDECMNRMKLEMKPSTIYNYEKQIRKWIHPHWLNLEINKITKNDVYDMIFDRCKEIVSPNNRKTVLKMLKRLFEMALGDGIIDRNPCTGITIKVPEIEQKVLTSPEVEIFLSEARITNHQFYPIWAVALMTGMRSGELFALKWSDVDLDGRMISVSRQWTNKNGIGPTKSRKSRMVPISDSLLVFLKERKLKSVAGSEFVLPQLIEWENGEQARITREFCASLGITQVKFHDLRATFITNLLARGESLVRVMSIVGHHQLKTTNCYLRKAGVEVQGGTDKLGYKLSQDHEAQVFKITDRK